jgi:hypothetical protein
VATLDSLAADAIALVGGKTRAIRIVADAAGQLIDE